MGFLLSRHIFDGVCNDLSARSLKIHVLNVELFVPSSTALGGQVSKANKPLVSVARSQRETKRLGYHNLLWGNASISWDLLPTGFHILKFPSLANSTKLTTKSLTYLQGTLFQSLQALLSTDEQRQSQKEGSLMLGSLEGAARDSSSEENWSHRSEVMFPELEATVSSDTTTSPRFLLPHFSHLEVNRRARRHRAESPNSDTEDLRTKRTRSPLYGNINIIKS